MRVASPTSSVCFIALPTAIWAASLLPLRVQIEMRSPLLRTFTTAPQISDGSENCSPMSASSVLSQYVSSDCRWLVFGQLNVHLPPLAHLGGAAGRGEARRGARERGGRRRKSEARGGALWVLPLGLNPLLEQVEVGAVDELRRREDVVVQAGAGGRIKGLRRSLDDTPRSHHQKSSTVENVYTCRSVEPYVPCFCRPLGLSNQSVQLCVRHAVAGAASARRRARDHGGRQQRTHVFQRVLLPLLGAAHPLLKWLSLTRSQAAALLHWLQSSRVVVKLNFMSLSLGHGGG